MVVTGPNTFSSLPIDINGQEHSTEHHKIVLSLGCLIECSQIEMQKAIDWHISIKTRSFLRISSRQTQFIRHIHGPKQHQNNRVESTYAK